MISTLKHSGNYKNGGFTPNSNRFVAPKNTFGQF